MPTTLRNTDILFNDGTTQSTAATGVPSSFNAIGSIVLAANFTTSNYFPGNTVAGSNFLVATGFSAVTTSDSAFVEGPNNVSPHAAWALSNLALLQGFRNGNIGAWQPTNTATLPGTWRVLSASRFRYVLYFSYDNSTQIRYFPVFIQRVS